MTKEENRDPDKPITSQQVHSFWKNQSVNFQDTKPETHHNQKSGHLNYYFKICISRL